MKFPLRSIALQGVQVQATIGGSFSIFLKRYRNNRIPRAIVRASRATTTTQPAAAAKTTITTMPVEKLLATRDSLLII